MTILEKINALISTMEIDNDRQKNKQIILGNWKSIRPEDELNGILKKLTEEFYRHLLPFYLALPMGMIKEFPIEGENPQIVIGTRTMHSAISGSFAEEVSVKLIMESGARFVVLNPHEAAVESDDPYAFMNAQLMTLLKERIDTFVVVAENYADMVEGYLDSLVSKLEVLFKGVPIDQMDHLKLIYIPSWIAIEGMDSLADNFGKSYHVFRALLGKVLGEEVSGKIPVMTAVPPFVENCASLIESSNFEGIYFSNLALQQDCFWKTLEDLIEV